MKLHFLLNVMIHRLLTKTGLQMCRFFSKFLLLQLAICNKRRDITAVRNVQKIN